MPHLAPKARDDLEYFDRAVEGEEVVLIRDPVRGTYLRFNPLQAAMLRALDGRRTAAEITAALSEQFDVEIPPAAAERFIGRARELMLLEITSYDVTSRAAREQVRKALRRAGLGARAPRLREPRPWSAGTERLAEAFRQLELGHPRAAARCLAEILQQDPDHARARQLYDLIQAAYLRAAGGTFDFPTWVLLDPSRLLASLSRTIGRLLFGWAGALALLALLGAGAYAYTNVSFEHVALGPLEIAIAIAILLISSLFHELGHGFACQHYGGRVTEIGFTLFYSLLPAFYCDTSSSYTITDRRHKLIIQLAGTIASLVFISAHAIVLVLLHPGVSIYPGLTLGFLVSSPFVFVNLIPLVKFDGYYGICDYFEFPNLRERSFRLTRAWLSGRLLGIELPAEELPRRTRTVLIAYAMASFAFTAWLIYFGYFRLLAPIVEHFRGAGLVFAVAATAYLLRNLTLRPVWRFARLLVRERRRIFTPRRTAVLLALAAAVIGPWFLQGPILVDAEFVVMPRRRADIRAQTAGRVEQIFVAEGDRVRRGQPLATLRNPALRARVASLEAELDAATEAERARVEGQLAHLRAEQALLTLRSPIDGVVATAHLDDQLQAMLAPGDLFAEVHDLDAAVAEISLSPSDPLGELAIGDEVALRPYGAPHGELVARVERFHEAAQDTGGERRIVAVTSPFALAPAITGLTGHARIYGAERSRAYSYFYMPLQRLVRVRLWSMW